MDKLNELKQEIITKPELFGSGPEAYMIIEWNRATQKMFRKGKRPMPGKRYLFRCERWDGKRAYFILEEQ